MSLGKDKEASVNLPEHRSRSFRWRNHLRVCQSTNENDRLDLVSTLLHFARHSLQHLTHRGFCLSLLTGQENHIGDGKPVLIPDKDG